VKTDKSQKIERIIMENLTEKQKKELDREAQVFKCLVCDEQSVRWNGKQFECSNCGRLYREPE
jgi:hypothetical protein